MAKLSTHILDTVHGGPAVNVRIDLFSLGCGSTLDAAHPPATPRLIVTVRTNADGRTDQPLLEGDAVKRGHYRLVFHIGDHFRAKGLTLADPPFIDIVPVEFGLEAGGSYHVPLVCSPWTYSTYRGS